MRYARGYTVVELLVVMAISLAMFTAFITWFFLTLNADNYSTNLLVSSEQARNVITTLTDELRETIPGEDGSYMIQTAEAEELTFFADVDLDQEAERVRYYRDGTNLMRGVTKASGFPAVYETDDETTTIVASYIANEAGNDLFTYYGVGYPDQIDPLGDPVPPNGVRLVRINVLIDVGDEHSREFNLESDVQLRNVENEQAL